MRVSKIQRGTEGTVDFCLPSQALPGQNGRRTRVCYFVSLIFSIPNVVMNAVHVVQKKIIQKLDKRQEAD